MEQGKRSEKMHLLSLYCAEHFTYTVSIHKPSEVKTANLTLPIKQPRLLEQRFLALDQRVDV